MAILENFEIKFEDEYFFSNGYKILKINDPHEEINYSEIHLTISERWDYWLNRWNDYKEDLFSQNILKIIKEMKSSIFNIKFSINVKLLNININILANQLTKIINQPNFLTGENKSELKLAIKCLNSVRNDIKRNLKILNSLINFLEELFEKVLPIDTILKLLFTELEKNTNAGLNHLDFLSDLLYVKIMNKNIDPIPSIFDLISKEKDNIKDLNDLKNFISKEFKLLVNPILKDYDVFYVIDKLNIISKIPPFNEIHFFNRIIDNSYIEKLGKTLPSFENWMRITVKAHGVEHALYLSENLIKKYKNFGILKNINFKIIRNNFIIFKNNKKIKSYFSIEHLRLHEIRNLDRSKFKELQEFLTNLESNLNQGEFQKTFAMTDLLSKIQNTFDFTDQLTFLWMIIETLNENESYIKEITKIFTIIDEIKLIQNFYMLFYPIIINNWKNFKTDYLSFSKLVNFPRDFTSTEFINSLEILSGAIQNNYFKQVMKKFSERSPISHCKRIELKNNLNLKLLFSVYKYRNQYFHSGTYNLKELRKVIPNLFQKLSFVIELYVSYLLANKNKNFEDFKTKWNSYYESLLIQLKNNTKYSECFPKLLELL